MKKVVPELAQIYQIYNNQQVIAKYALIYVYVYIYIYIYIYIASL